MTLGEVAVTGGLEKVVIFIIKTMTKKLWNTMDEKYSIKEKATEWGEKVVSRVKSRRKPHTSPSLPATLRVASLAVDCPEYPSL